MTPLDTAHAAMTDAPNDDRARLDFYERLADAELFLLLTEESDGTQVKPSVFETSEGAFALAFDREDRLTTFTEGPAPYAALSGRAIARQHPGN
ncbi:MAG: SseB family protein, partial [Pseudomonadota bacterium]